MNLLFLHERAVKFLKNRLRAFVYAFSGLFEAFKREDPLKVELSAAFVTLLAAWQFGLSRYEWLSVIACIALVFIAELFNTAMEKLCDTLRPDRDESIRYIKDISAAAVLVACLFSLCVAALVFIPKMFA